MGQIIPAKGLDQIFEMPEESQTKRRSKSLKEKRVYETIDFKPLPRERKDEAKTTDWLDQGQLEEKEEQNEEKDVEESIISQEESCDEDARNKYKLTSSSSY